MKKLLVNVQPFINELKIENCKKLYRSYLSELSPRRNLLRDLSLICKKFDAVKEGNVHFVNQDIFILFAETQEFLETHFHSDVSVQFGKQSKDFAKKTYSQSVQHNSFWLSFCKGILDVLENVNQEMKASFAYKKEFLRQVYESLYYFGLHPAIELRSPATSMRFNVKIAHYHNSKSREVAFAILISSEELNSHFVKPFFKHQSILIDGMLIPFKKIHKIEISSTLLKDDEISLFSDKMGFKWDIKNQNKNDFFDNCLNETSRLLVNPFDFEKAQVRVDEHLLGQTRVCLRAYPDAEKLFISAMDKYSAGVYSRNLLDDLRLALELLLKALLGNNFPLEKQLPSLGKYKKGKGASSEIVNIYLPIIDYFGKYHNKYVKHDDAVKEEEIVFIVEQTLILMRFAIR